MATYQVSETTRNALIHAAGELFALRGAESVSVREITARAGVKVNAISYHFGGKEKLVDAVIDYALSNWKNQRLTDYFEAHKEQLDSRTGQRELVTALLGIYYDTLYPPGQPVWMNMFLLRTVFNNSYGKERIAEVTMDGHLHLFAGLFRHITGDEDFETARFWFGSVTAAISFYASNLSLEQCVPGNEVNHEAYERLCYWATRNALSGLGLLEKP